MSTAPFFLALSALAAGALGQAAPTPPTMQAYMQVSVTDQRLVKDVKVPTLGELHTLYSDLPDSCEVLVQVAWSSVNPSDRHPNVASTLLPHVLGSDISGVVLAVQPSCRSLKVGDQVYGDIGANTLTVQGAKTKELGGYGQYTLALETQLGVVPTAMSLEVAGSLPKVALTSYKALVWYAGAKNDSLWQKQPTVLVLGGSGGCGTVGLQLAKAYGAGRLITTTSKDNFEYCKGIGATETLDYHTQNWWDDKLIPDNTVDVIYDTVGQAFTGDRAMKKLKTGGHYVTITGQMASHVKPGVTQHEFINSDTNLDNVAIWDDLNALAAAGRLTMPSVTAYPLANLSGAFATSAGGQVKGKLTISLN